MTGKTAFAKNRADIYGVSNISNMSDISVRYPNRPSPNTAAYYGSDVLDYPERLNRRAVRGNNAKNPKFHNRNKDKDIISGDQLTTPVKRKGLAALKGGMEVRLREKTIFLAKAKLPVTIFAYTLMVTLVFLGLIYSYTLLNEQVVAISKANESIVNAQRDELYLTRQLEMKNNSIEFERIAVEELGMVREDTLPKRYISLKNKDKVQKMDGNEDFFTRIVTTVQPFFAPPPE